MSHVAHATRHLKVRVIPDIPKQKSNSNVVIILGVKCNALSLNSVGVEEGVLRDA